MFIKYGFCACESIDSPQQQIIYDNSKGILPQGKFPTNIWELTLRFLTPWKIFQVLAVFLILKPPLKKLASGTTFSVELTIISSHQMESVLFHLEHQEAFF